MDNKWEWSFVRSDPNYLWLLGMIWNYTVFNGSLAICLGPKSRRLMLQSNCSPSPYTKTFAVPVWMCLVEAEGFPGPVSSLSSCSSSSSSICMHDILMASAVLQRQIAWLAVITRRVFKIWLKQKSQQRKGEKKYQLALALSPVAPWARTLSCRSRPWLHIAALPTKQASWTSPPPRNTSRHRQVSHPTKTIAACNKLPSSVLETEWPSPGILAQIVVITSTALGQ